VVHCTVTYAAAAVLVWSVAGGVLGEAANAHAKQAGSPMAKMTTSVPIGKIRITPQRGFIR